MQFGERHQAFTVVSPPPAPAVFNPPELQNAQTAEEFTVIRERHDCEWFPQLAACFEEIASDYSLRWDIEHDEVFEDVLYGTFTLSTAVERIEQLVTAIQRWAEYWRKREAGE